MEPKVRNNNARIQLPVQVISPVDINRLIREVEGLDDFLMQAAIRTPGSSMKLPRTSKLLDEFVAVNRFNLLQTADRRATTNFLQSVKQHAPVLHISFASDPTAAFTVKLILWLRTNIHPYLLLRIGLEPRIAAGCIVRTPNKQYDFSLWRHFSAQRDQLIDAITSQASRN
jgi:hypothetical protein